MNSVSGKHFGKAQALILCIILFVTIELFIGVSDSAVSLVLRLIVSMIFSYCVYKGLQEDLLLNPYFLFALTPLSLLLYTEKISSHYLVKLSEKTWLLAVINMLAFLIVYTKTKGRIRIKWRSSVGCINKCKVSRTVSLSRIRFHAYLMSIIGAIPSLYGFIAHGEFPLKSIIGFYSYIGVAFAFKSRDRHAIMLTIILSASKFLDDFNKTRLLYIVITILICIEIYEVKSKRERLKFFAGAILASLAFIVIAFPLKSYMRNGGNFLFFLQSASDISSTAFSHYEDRISFSGPSFLKMPYMYLISAWNNVEYVMQTQNTRTYGLWMLKPLLGYLQIDSYFNNYYKLISYSSFNTFTYITVLFKDFGLIGSTFGSAFLGYYIKRVYLSISKNESAFNAAAYALVAMATLEMFFSNHFYSLSYPFTIVIIGYLYKKVLKLEGY